MSREEIISANPIADFVRNRGHDLKPAGDNFRTSGCPVKQHKKWHRPNTIDPAKNLWHCNDCGGGGTVIDWLAKEKRISVADAMRELGGGRNDSEPRKFIRAYDYTDERGELLYQVCRFEQGTQSKTFKARRGPDDPECKLGIKGVRRVLYRLPEVIKAQLVCITEGEKNADDLARLGFVATTNPFGAGKWDKEYNEFLRGKGVVVFGDVGDPDRTGEKHTEQVIASLLSSGIAARHAQQPDGFHDVSDFIESLPPEAAKRAAIQKLIDEAPLIDQAQPRNGEPVELPPPPYVPPPLDLLPGVLQDYVHEAAESLNVDVAFILLPLLSALGSAVGNTRSILLKRNFIQPPVIWSAIIGRSGSRKSPALEAGCFAVVEHERELMRQNKQAMEIYENDMAERESKTPKERGVKPALPVSLTCLMDDMTLAALADALEENPRGVLVKKDELSHWFASFDQYTKAKGADVSQWLSLHTGGFFGLDRRSDHRRYRIHQPRVALSGGIQPEVLKRILTEDFFERGLPARFLFAYPPFMKDRWTEAEIPDNLRAAVLALFQTLWELEPNHDARGEACPKLLRLDADAKAEYVHYYDECGDASVEAGEREEAAWSKLSGYAARLALIGQLAHDPDAVSVTCKVMAAACNLARWSGNEAARIYATFAETPEQCADRQLAEFMQKRGGEATIRAVMQSHWPLKNKREEIKAAFNRFVARGWAEWREVKPDGPGRPTSVCRLLRTSTSTQLSNLPEQTDNSVDVDAPNSQKNTPSREPDTEAETLVGDETGVARL